MTPEQEQHLARVKGMVDAAIDTKYRAGQKEHGGDLFTLSKEALVAAAIDEAIDQVVYLVTLRDVLRDGEPNQCAQGEPVKMPECGCMTASPKGVFRCSLPIDHTGPHASGAVIWGFR